MIRARALAAVVSVAALAGAAPTVALGASPAHDAKAKKSKGCAKGHSSKKKGCKKKPHRSPSPFY